MITRGRVVGVIELLNKYNGNRFMDADATLLSILAHVAATALEDMRSRLEDEED
jgi:GAF domain-containing protein